MLPVSYSSTMPCWLTAHFVKAVPPRKVMSSSPCKISHSYMGQTLNRPNPGHKKAAYLSSHSTIYPWQTEEKRVVVGRNSHKTHEYSCTKTITFPEKPQKVYSRNRYRIRVANLLTPASLNIYSRRGFTSYTTAFKVKRKLAAPQRKSWNQFSYCCKSYISLFLSIKMKAGNILASICAFTVVSKERHKDSSCNP